MNKKRKGFTLLEILLVIAAIGILASIVLVAINPNRQINQVRQVRINSEKNTIEKALQQDLIDTGSYPTAIDGVQRKICSNTVTTDCINITTDLVPTYIAAIPSSTTYTVARGNDGRVYVNTPTTQANLTCPTGYIKVPGNSMYQTKDFCVMKYEAKATSPKATTEAANPPAVDINQTDAATACSNNNTGGITGYGLINNREWMTIARNIEAQSSNWSNNTISNANSLNRGHSDYDPAIELAASTNDLEGCTGYTNGRSCTNQWHVNRRTHTLSNGETIWDLSGNVWEWTNDIILGQNKPNSSSGNFWQKWTDISNFGTLNYDLTRPSNTSWNSFHDMGNYYAGTVTGTTPFAFLRGGDWDNYTVSIPEDDYTITGIFALTLSVTPSFTDSKIGFRCVFR